MFGQKSQVCHAATPLDADAFRKRMAFNEGFANRQAQKEANIPPPKLHCFLETAMPSDANTRFSAYLRNHLTSNILQIFAIIPHARFHIAPCKTCLIALRNMPDRTSIPYVSQDDTWSFATRMGIFRKTNAQKHVFRSAKTPVSRSISPRNANHLFNQKS